MKSKYIENEYHTLFGSIGIIFKKYSDNDKVSITNKDLLNNYIESMSLDELKEFVNVLDSINSNKLIKKTN